MINRDASSTTKNAMNTKEHLFLRVLRDFRGHESFYNIRFFDYYEKGAQWPVIS
jgi:hypothetical protein